MYSSCLFCHSRLGSNTVLPTFPVGQKLAFDASKGRLWVICPECERWNLTPLEERWEAIDESERRFRGTPLRVFSENIGLARLAEGVELVRVGHALAGEIAAWRYGRTPPKRSGGWEPAVRRGVEVALTRGGDTATMLLRRLPRTHLRYPVHTWLKIRARADRALAFAPFSGGDAAVIRYRHLPSIALLRPERQEHWRLQLNHEAGLLVLSAEAGLRAAGKLLAAINGRSGTSSEVRAALGKVEDAGRSDGYFVRVARLALRTSWGRYPDAPGDLPTLPPGISTAERLALQLTNRAFWAQGGIGSEPSTPLLHLPLVDRLALEMAANEDVERRALDGELASLHAAWREAEEIAAIADSLPDSRVPARAEVVLGLPLRVASSTPQ